jgi:hypothetical protein
MEASTGGMMSSSRRRTKPGRMPPKRLQGSGWARQGCHSCGRLGTHCQAKLRYAMCSPGSSEGLTCV